MKKFHKFFIMGLGLFAVLFFSWGIGILTPTVAGGIVSSYIASYFFLLNSERKENNPHKNDKELK